MRLLWIVLCFNVTAGIGVLGQAPALVQELFPVQITASAAAGFVGLLSYGALRLNRERSAMCPS